MPRSDKKVVGRAPLPKLADSGPVKRTDTQDAICSSPTSRRSTLHEPPLPHTTVNPDTQMIETGQQFSTDRSRITDSPEQTPDENRPNVSGHGDDSHSRGMRVLNDIQDLHHQSSKRKASGSDEIGGEHRRNRQSHSSSAEQAPNSRFVTESSPCDPQIGSSNLRDNKAQAKKDEH